MLEGERYPYEFVKQDFQTYETFEVSEYVVIGRSAAELHCGALQKALELSGKNSNGDISWFMQRTSRRAPVLKRSGHASSRGRNIRR